MEDFPFLPQILHTRRIDNPVMMWIQIRARKGGGGGGGACSPGMFFLIKWCNLAHSECSKYVIINLLINKKAGAQWLSGRVLGSRPRTRGFEPHQRHCVVSLSKTH